MARCYILQLVAALYMFPYYGETTRFLPMVVWDHLNPQLKCRCNWPVIPHMDRYDRLEFVCPTLKIAMNQLDGYSRPETEMNENIFRREWYGSEDDLKKSIQDGSIQPFCDPSKSTKLHTCREGAYSSTAVTFKNSRDETRRYRVEHIYIFYNNADDGRESSLGSTKINCSMLFAVYISDQEKVEHDFTFGKTALSDSCTCKEPISLPPSSCPSPRPTATLQRPPIQPTSTRQSIPTIIQSTTSVQPTEQPTGLRSVDVFVDSQQTDDTGISSIYTTTILRRPSSEPTTGEPATNRRKTSETPVKSCNYPWLSTWMLVIFISSTIMLPIVLCWCACVLLRRKPNKQEGFNNNEIYYTRAHPHDGQHFADKVNSPRRLEVSFM